MNTETRPVHRSRLVPWAAVLLAAAAAPGLRAWSSKDLPYFEPVHQMAIANILGSVLPPDQIAILQQAQVDVDTHQKFDESFMHAMTGLDAGQALADEMPVYIGKSEDFVRANLTDAIARQRAGDTAGALQALGTALHTLEDATSPAHRGFQPWSRGESVFEMAVHVMKERVYPTDTSDPEEAAERKALEASVQWGYDIFTGKRPMPDHFFSPQGALNLP